MTDFLSMFDIERLGVSNHARRNPDKPALIMNDKTITFKELDRSTNTLANGLLSYGLKPGDRVAVLMHNSPEIMETLGAAGKIGVTPIAMNYRFKEEELAYIINDSESKVLIYGQKFQEIVDKAKSKLTVPSLSYVCAGESPSPDVASLKDIQESGQDTPPATDPNLHGVSSVLIYTSGTTGKPKGVFKTGKNRLNSILGYAHTFESTHDDTHLVAGPLYHSAPYAWASLSMVLGNTTIIMPRFNAEEFLRLIEKYRATSTFVVPTMLNRIINLPPEVKERYDHSSLRVMIMGGESCPFPVKKKAVEFFNKTGLFEFYGGTESAVVTYLRPEDQLRKPGSCGKAVLGSEFKLLNEKMEEVPTGEVGVLYVKGDYLMDGYYKNPIATKACYHGDYLTIGDMARVDDEGYFYIVDRSVDMVVSGGVNIYPAEIEEVLHDHPGVYDASVIGAPDPDWEEKLVAYVVLQDGSEMSETDIIDYIGSRIADYKKPKELYIINEIPYSPSGKQLKRVLRTQYTNEQ